MMQTYNVFANMDILKPAGIKAPTAKSPWTWAAFRAIAKQLTNADRFGVCWGLRSPTAAIQTMALNYGGQYFYLEGGQWNFRHGAAEQAVVTNDPRHDPCRQVRRRRPRRPLRHARAARRSSAASAR